MKKIIISMLAALALTPATAHANDTAIADAAWPDSPCAGRLHVVVSDSIEKAYGYDGLALGRPGMTAAGPGPLTSCDLQIIPGLTPERRCEVIVHEAGHLAGFWHTDSSYSGDDPHMLVMLPNDHPWAACEPHLTKRQDAVALIKDSLPSRYKWTINCNPGVTRCRATALHAKPRRYAVTRPATGTTVTDIKARS